MSMLQRHLEDSLGYISAIAVAFMMAITVADVLVRFLTSYSVPGSYAFVSLAFVPVIFLGLAAAQRDDQHIVVDALYNKLGRGPKKLLQVAQLAVLLLFFAGLTWYTGLSAWQNFVRNDTILGAIQVPTWPARAMIPLGFLFLTLRLLVQLVALLGRDELIEEGVAKTQDIKEH